MDRKSVLFIIFLLLVGIMSSAAVYFSYNYFEKDGEINTEIGGSKDDHGCLLSAGYSWCANKQACLRPWEEPCSIQEEKININNIIEEVSQNSNSELKFLENTDFEWFYEENDEQKSKTFSGYKYEDKNGNGEMFFNIRSYFETGNYVVDQYNLKRTVSGEIYSYYKNKLMCQLEYSTGSPLLEYNSSEIFTKNQAMDITLTCGYAGNDFDPSIATNLTKNKLKAMFIGKYQQPADKIEVEFTEKTDSHARGIVRFLPEEPGNAGIFLTAKTRANWTLVFDGNGSYKCEDVAAFNFPDSMIKDCVK